MSDPTIRPADEIRDQFLENDDGGPFVMVNFLKFKPGGGSREYGKYGAAFAKLIVERGGRFLYNGRVAHKFVGDEDWHAVALVEYPSRKVFHELTTSASTSAGDSITRPASWPLPFNCSAVTGEKADGGSCTPDGLSSGARMTSCASASSRRSVGSTARCPRDSSSVR